MARQWTVGEKIALFALVVAMLPLFDLVHRKVTIPKIEVLPPTQVEFRTNDVVRKLDDFGQILGHQDGSPVIVESETGNNITYIVVPLSYINRGDPGEGFLIPLEKLYMKLDEDLLVYESYYTTEIVSKPSPSWLGDPGTRLPAMLEGGSARSDEVIFVPQDKDSVMQWTKFIKKLEEQQKDSTIEIILEIVTHSGKVFRSPPCQLAINHLLTPIQKTKPDRLRYYRTQAECESQTG